MASLTFLKSTDTEYTSIRNQFINGLSNARIHSIIKIDMPSHIADKHETYKKLNQVPQVQRLYHGTKYCCDIANLSDINRLCQNAGCG